MSGRALPPAARCFLISRQGLAALTMAETLHGVNHPMHCDDWKRVYSL
jgi:hypothetical protein